jgi:signal transduction histidine kinase
VRLEAKLALLGIGTALLAVVLVALISRRSTVFLVERRVAEDDRRGVAAALIRVESWRAARGSWHGAQQMLDATAIEAQHDLLLLDDTGHCVAASPAALCAEEIRIGPDERLTLRSRPGARADVREVIGASNTTVPGDGGSGKPWTLFVLPSFPHELAMPARFIDSLSASLWLGGAIAAGIAVIVSLLVARTLVRPVRILIAEAGAMGAGDLSRRVPVTGRSEISQLGAAFNAMAEGLARQEQLRKDLLHDVAHELRAPLTNIRCQLEAVQDGLARLEPPAIASLHEEVMLLSRLVDDLRDIALAEAGQLQLTLAPCDVAAETRRVVEMVRPAAAERRVVLALEAPPTAVARADAGRFVQILNNLLSNAIRHSPSPGAVRVVVRKEHPWIAVDVEDDGPGISPEHVPRVFERFFRTDAARTREGGGAGLGLAIVKQLTELQGGSVEVSSVVGSGTRFTVRLSDYS